MDGAEHGAPAAPEKVEAFDRRAREVLGRFDRAQAAALVTSAFEGVYTSPWWETYTRGGTSRSRAWKRSVLRRVPGRGAEPWGHLFLIVAEGAPRSPEGSLTPEDLPGPAAAAPVGDAVLLAQGEDSVWVLARPRDPSTGVALGALVRAVQRAFPDTATALPVVGGEASSLSPR